MNEITNKFLLAGGKLTPDRHFELSYSACWRFTKNKEQKHKSKKTWDSKNIYKIELGKACF